MKTKRANAKNQRAAMDRKAKPWLSLRKDQAPPSGWLKAIRGSLGLTTRQLADRLGVQHPVITRFEEREVEGTISLESIQKVAKAMRCQFVYAIVPEGSFPSFENVLEDQALESARKAMTKVDHSMKLEKQGVSDAQTADQLHDLAKQLKEKMDPSLWGEGRSKVKRKKPK